MSTHGTTEPSPAAELEQHEEEAHNDGEQETVVSEEVKLLRRKRGRQLAAFSRICHRADAMIVGRGSRSKLEDMLETIDAALENVIAANDSLEAYLSLPKEKMDAEAYSAKAEGDRQAVVQRITRYLAERKDEAPSEAGSRISVARKSCASSSSKASQVEAEVSSKMKKLRLQQLRRKQEQERAEEEEKRRQEEAKRRQEEATRRQEEEIERHEREIQRRRQLQDAEDEAEAAQMEARLRKELSDELQEERRDDFEGELLDRDQAEGGDQYLVISEAADRRPARATHEGGTRHGRPAEGLTASKVRDTATWIQELRSPHVQPADKAAACSAFAKSIPRLSLPTFDGKASDWPRWIGLFKALVHDQPSLSDTERIAHLQSSVSGLAQQTISGMLYDGSLYHQALQTLEERFGQDEDIIKHNLNSIFDAPDPLEDDAESLERFQATLHCAVTILKNLGSTADLYSSDSLQRTVVKLPKELRREWGKFALELSPTRPSLLDVDSWLRTQVKISRYCPKGKQKADETVHRPRKEHPVETARRQAFATAAKPAPLPTCYLCAGGHDLEQCQTFRGRSPDARLKLAFDQQLCLHCLKKGHRVRDCRKARPCRKDGCRYRHHALLHGSQPARARGSGDPNVNPGTGKEETAQSSDRCTEQGRVVAAAACQHQNKNTVTLLQVVPVRVHGRNGIRDTFALLDPGAQTSLCSNKLADRLDITGEAQELCVQTVEGSGQKQTARKMMIELSSPSADAAQKRIKVPEVWAVPRLNIPMPRINRQQRSTWRHLDNLDVPDYSTGEVEILLGANVIEAVIQHEVRAGASGQPVAIRTDFGWALTGEVPRLAPETPYQVLHIQPRETADVTERLKEWWSMKARAGRHNQPATESGGTRTDLMYAEASSNTPQVMFLRRAIQPEEDVPTISLEEHCYAKLSGTKTDGSLPQPKWDECVLSGSEHAKCSDDYGTAARRLQAAARGANSSSKMSAACQAAELTREVTAQLDSVPPVRSPPPPPAELSERPQPTKLEPAEHQTCQMAEGARRLLPQLAEDHQSVPTKLSGGAAEDDAHEAQLGEVAGQQRRAEQQKIELNTHLERVAANVQGAATEGGHIDGRHLSTGSVELTRPCEEHRRWLKSSWPSGRRGCQRRGVSRTSWTSDTGRSAESAASSGREPRHRKEAESLLATSSVLTGGGASRVN